LTCARDAHIAALPIFRKKLEALQPHPDIINCLTYGITSHTRTFRRNNTPTHTIAAAQDQDTIGWSATMEGRLSKSWRVLQSTHYFEHHPKRSVDRWAASTIEALWTVTHSIWTARNKLYQKQERDAECLEAHTTRIETITNLFTHTRRLDLLLADRYLLDGTLEQCLTKNKTASAQETWIQAMQWAIESATEMHQTENTSLRTTLHQWLDAP
jgi:hypothetical protein